MLIRQIAPFVFVICSAIGVACSSNTNSTGSLMPATIVGNHRNVQRTNQTPPPKGWQFYTPNPFASAVCASDPCSPKLDKDSDPIVKQMMNGKFSMGQIQVAQPGTNGGDGESDEDPVYYTNGRDPSYTISCTVKVYTPQCGRLFPTVQIPNGAYASADSDHHASVIVRSSGQTNEYDFWEFNCYAAPSHSIHSIKVKGKCKGTTAPVSGGGTVYVSYGSTCNANSFANKGTCWGSAVAAGVPMQPGLLDPRELTAAQIKHVLYVAVGCPNGNNVWPAARSDGYPKNCSVQGGPAEGKRIWLDLTNSQINHLSDPKWAKAILHAMHNYGFFVVDTAGDFKQPWNFYALDSATFTYIGKPDPWAAFLDDIGCGARSNPCGYSKNASHLPIPLAGISKSHIHILR